MAKPTKTIANFLTALRHATRRKGYTVLPVNGQSGWMLMYSPNGSTYWNVLEVVYDAYYRRKGQPMPSSPGELCGLRPKDARLVHRAGCAHPGHNRKLRQALWNACGHTTRTPEQEDTIPF